MTTMERDEEFADLRGLRSMSTRELRSSRNAAGISLTKCVTDMRVCLNEMNRSIIWASITDFDVFRKSLHEADEMLCLADVAGDGLCKINK